MSEVLLLPEMLAAGLEAFEESKRRSLEMPDTVVAVYLAMRAVEEIARDRKSEETVH